MSDTTPTIKDAIKALAQAVPGVLARYETIKDNTAELLRFFRQLRDVNSQINDICKILNELEDNLSYNLIPEYMENNQLENVKSLGYTYILNVKTLASIPLDMRIKGHKWLEENGYKAVITEQVNPKTLSSIITNHIVEHGIKPPEDAIKVYQKRYISVRKS